MDKIPMTPEGHSALKDELRQLVEVERPKVSKEIGVAREHGDLRENAEYHAAKDKQGLIEARVAEIEDKLSRAEVIDTSLLSGEVVRFGAIVALEESDSGKAVEYRIVGPDESDIRGGSISVSSPLARAIIGKRAGEEVEVQAPGGKRFYEITAVRWR
ncbi:MAG: transcription elongation factor GreA [Myxococcales bacterium]|nr:transcription elongation factor GreA [Myxococcales bacterium]MCB9708521.1 transcription elongation factor GreA [Myxococcales bacterium]